MRQGNSRVAVKSRVRVSQVKLEIGRACKFATNVRLTCMIIYAWAKVRRVNQEPWLKKMYTYLKTLVPVGYTWKDMEDSNTMYHRLQSMHYIHGLVRPLSLLIYTAQVGAHPLGHIFRVRVSEAGEHAINGVIDEAADLGGWVKEWNNQQSLFTSPAKEYLQDLGGWNNQQSFRRTCKY